MSVGLRCAARALAVSIWALIATGLSVYWIAHAQQVAAEDDRRFTGQSTSLDTDGMRLSRRRFEAGARSAWHRHTHGQLLYVVEGRARTQKRGGVLRELGVGDTDYTGPNIEHWHGATPDMHFVQVAVSFGEGIEWLEKVSDAQYRGE